MCTAGEPVGAYPLGALDHLPMPKHVSHKLHEARGVGMRCALEAEGISCSELSSKEGGIERLLPVSLQLLNSILPPQ